MRPPTHFEWSWDDRDGNRFKRFSRSGPVEAWLIGIERPDDPSQAHGRAIGVSPAEVYEAKMVILPFAFSPKTGEMEKEALGLMMDACVVEKRLDWEAVERLYTLSDQARDYQEPTRRAARTAADQLDDLVAGAMPTRSADEVRGELRSIARTLRDSLEP